jgi:succinoglycan biosynthesis transport protein ExoP
VIKREPTFQDYFDIVYKRRVLVIVCVVIAALGALIVSMRLPKVYEAKVKFKLDLSENQTTFFGELYLPRSVDPVENELEIVRSRAIAQLVVRKLGLRLVPDELKSDYFDSVSVGDGTSIGRYLIRVADTDFTLLSATGADLGKGRVGELFNNGAIQFLLKTKPKADIEFTIQKFDETIDDFMANISAAQIKNTSLVLLKVRSYNAVQSSRIANAVAQEYIDYSLMSLRESARGSKEFIETQIATFGYELDSAEEKLRVYKEKTGIFLLTESAKEIITSSADFEVEKEKATIELTEAQRGIEQMEAELSKDEATYGAYKKMASFPTISNSPMIVSLREKLKGLELQKQELLASGSSDGEIALLNGKIKVTEEEISKATKQIAMAGPSVEDPIFQSIISNIITDEIRVITMQSRIDALDQIINHQNYRLKQLPEAEVNLAQLERQKKANEEIYTMLLGKLEESKIAEAMQISQARIIDYAITPEYPVGPKVKQNSLLGFLLGLILGLGGAFLIEYLDTSLKSAREVEDLTGISVLASIPVVRDKNTTQIPTIREPHSDIAEAYRILRTNLSFSAAARPIKVILVTSTLPQEGKTTTCINLGITLAQQGHRTIMLDCDFRRPMFHVYFKDFVPDNQHGLSDVLIDKLKLKEAIVKNSFGELFFMTSGTIPTNPAELLGSVKMHKILDELRNEYDFVLIDAPPALGIADARVLGKICDGIVVVVMANKTNRDDLIEVKEELERAGEKLVGFVFNGLDMGYRRYRHRYYHYHSYSAKAT